MTILISLAICNLGDFTKQNWRNCKSIWAILLFNPAQITNRNISYKKIYNGLLGINRNIILKFQIIVLHLQNEKQSKKIEFPIMK